MAADFGELSRAEEGAGRVNIFDLGLISAAHGVSDGYTNLILPLLPLVVAEFGLDPFGAGLIVSALSFGTLLFQYPLSVLSDYTGRRRTILVAGLGLAGVSFLGVALTRSYWPLVALSLLAGAGNSVYHASGTALVAERFAARRGFCIGIHGLGGNVGTSLLPLAAGALASVVSWRAVLAICVVPALLLLPILAVRFSDAARSGPRSAGRRGGLSVAGLQGRVFRNPAVLLLAVVYTLRGLGVKGMIAFLPLLASQELGMGTRAIGLAVACYFATGAVCKPILGALYDRTGPRLALAIAMAGMGLFTLLLGWTPWAWAVFPLTVLLGMVSFVSPLVLTAVADLAEEGALASSVGLIYTLHSLNFLSPLIGGWIALAFHLRVSFAFFALMALLSA
ncbi:MAG: MFS transporter, partial [Nitrospinota bacterium]